MCDCPRVIILLLCSIIFQLGANDTFGDVCPLLDGSVSYVQHVRVDTDLQLTTRNLPDTVSRGVVEQIWHAVATHINTLTSYFTYIRMSWILT